MQGPVQGAELPRGQPFHVHMVPGHLPCLLHVIWPLIHHFAVFFLGLSNKFAHSEAGVGAQTGGVVV